MKIQSVRNLLVALACVAYSPVCFAEDAAPAGQAKLDIKLPKPMFIGTPKNIRAVCSIPKASKAGTSASTAKATHPPR